MTGRRGRIRLAVVAMLVALIVLLARFPPRRARREVVAPSYLDDPLGSLARPDLERLSAVLAELGDTPFTPLPDDATRLTLGRFLATLERIGPRTRPELFPTLKDRIAYLLNAHMAWALALNDGGGLVPEGLTDVRTVRFPLDGTTSTLAAIESEIILRARDDPCLVLFLNPGFAGGPPLARAALRSYALDFQTSAQARRCGRAPGFWSLDQFTHRLGVSEITEYLPGLPQDRRERARFLLALTPPRPKLRQRIDATCGSALESCGVVLIPLTRERAEESE